MIRDLTSVVPAPTSPIPTCSGDDWIVIQDELGIHLPNDLRDFGLTYGSGKFCNDFLRVFNPFDNRYRNEIEDELYTLREARKRGMKYLVYPERPGLFPWGLDANGNKFLWLTEGEPNEWTVVVYKRSDDEPIEFSLSMTSFLAKAFRNELDVEPWQSEPFKDSELSFKQDTRSVAKSRTSVHKKVSKQNVTKMPKKNTKKSGK